MEDVLALYERPIDDREPVVCLDEKPAVLHANARPALRMENAEVRRDYEYRRLGTANVFCCIEPKAGRHHLKVTKTRDRFAFAEMMRDVAARYPDARVIHCVLDNLSTHSAKSLTDRFGARDGMRLWGRFKVHHTPKHASWLNQAEIQIGMFSRECLGNRRLAAIEILEAEAEAWAAEANLLRRRINWTFSRSDARKKFRYRVSTEETRSDN
jgi:hypothetical protein